jgi:hypothetical protein
MGLVMMPLGNNRGLPIDEGEDGQLVARRPQSQLRQGMSKLVPHLIRGESKSANWFYMRRQGRFSDRKNRKAWFDSPLDFLCSFCRLGCYSFAPALPILLICIQEQVEDRLTRATRALTQPSTQVRNSKHIPTPAAPDLCAQRVAAVVHLY